VTAQHYGESEQTILNILRQLEGPASQRLRVLVTDWVAYIDGHVAEYRQAHGPRAIGLEGQRADYGCFLGIGRLGTGSGPCRQQR
jgi:hypothetical protein